MNSKKFSEAMSEVDDKYYEEAVNYKKGAKKSVWAKWGTLAACLCLALGAAFTAPEFVQLSDVGTQQPQPGSPIDSPAQPQPSSPIDSPAQPQPNNPIISPAQDEANKHKAQDIVIDETMTWEEAQHSEPFGGYLLSEAPAGFTAETIQRYQDENTNYLYGLWTKGEGSFDEISWRVSFYDETMENRVTSVDDIQNYDLSLYPFPLADSVPEELFEIVDHPIFNMDELTLEAVNRRAYSTNESNDTSEIRMSFGVRYGDIVVEVTTKGVSPEWVYDQLVNIYQYKSCINFRSGE
ncbi:MAG: hypothetical protein J6A08_10110 [Lachnospiraceae bacterium]|nr:hypothetical protein [Lachnospiraceae bacterium]